jgi:hypothetical protein
VTTIAAQQPKAKARLRRTRVDFLIPYLSVPVAWQVGRATFRPPGWLERQVQRDVQSVRIDARGFPLEPLKDTPWSSASVWTERSRDDVLNIDREREMVRDSIALARLYQRACLPVENLDAQTFGLAPDVTSDSEYHWKSDYKGYAGHGWSKIGILGPFTFRADWIRAFRDRPAFAFLDDALRGSDPAAGSWAQRGITAIRLLNLASPVRTQPIRIVLQTAALEALLADDPLPEPWKARAQAHPVAQRGAFLTCDRPDGAKLPAGGEACAFLGVDGAKAAERVLPGRPANYWDWPCTYYWHIREVFDARNRALHEALDQFRKSTAAKYEGRVDDVILAALEWAVASGAAGISDLDTKMADLPKERDQSVVTRSKPQPGGPHG